VSPHGDVGVAFVPNATVGGSDAHHDAAVEIGSSREEAA